MEGRFSEGMGWSKAKNDFPWNWIDKVCFSQSTTLRTTQKIEFMVRTFPSAIFDLRCLYGLINASDRLEIHHLFSKHQKKTSKFHAVSNTMVENSLIWVNNFLTKCTKLAISNLKINDFSSSNSVIDHTWVSEDITFLSGLWQLLIWPEGTRTRLTVWWVSHQWSRPMGFQMMSFYGKTNTFFCFSNTRTKKSKWKKIKAS